MGTAWHTPGLARLDAVLSAHVERGDAGAVTWTVARHDEVHGGTAGSAARDTIFRIASMTKPVTAVAALTLVEDCLIRLDDPVDEWLPELADRRVLARPEGPLEDTVPAARPISLRDLLTFRCGMGFDFTTAGPQPVIEAAAELELGAGPPAPAGPPEPDEWMRRLGTLPLSRQPGERWLYHTSADVLGVLVARVAGRPLPEVLAERVLGPLGMADTGFHVPPPSLDRFGPCYVTAPDRPVYDPPDGQWSEPPAFPSGGGGPGVDRGRLPGLRHHAPQRRHVPGAPGPVPPHGRGHDHQPPERRPARRRRSRPGRCAGLGLRPRRPGPCAPARPARWAATAGTGASAARGPTTRPRT